MHTIRINGLVKTATRVRQELSGPLSGERRAVLRNQVSRALQQVDDILRQAGTTVEALAAPSRKAYRFLSTLDFDAVKSSEAAPSNGRPAGSVSFRGLRRALEGMLDRFVLAEKHGRLEEVWRHICSHSEHLETVIRKDSITPEQLTRPTREIRAWLAYFAQRDHFEDYVGALHTATSCFVDAARSLPKPPSEVYVRFRPMRGLYRLRAYRNVLLVQLPTPMISFARETFEVVAGLALRRNGQKHAVVEAMRGEPYQSVLGELELLAGVADTGKGIWHDLAQSFERVNAAYFSGALARPRLVWSPVFTSRKFGHYDLAHDTVMISATLDRNDVPALVVDFIMYHELLHKKLGVTWTNGRKSAHSADFAQEERRYLDYDKAQIILKKVAGDAHGHQLIEPQEASGRHGVAPVESECERKTCKPRLPRARRNAPCPCGSGRKYKKCCGR